MNYLAYYILKNGASNLFLVITHKISMRATGTTGFVAFAKSLSTGLFTLDTASTEIKLSAQGTRHPRASKELCAENPFKLSRHTCAEKQIKFSAKNYQKRINKENTTGNPGFAESRKLSAKANKPSAKALPTVALGTGLTENFFSATALCRAPELEALGTGCAKSPQWAVGQKSSR
jgi:hypothetical protein